MTVEQDGWALEIQYDGQADKGFAGGASKPTEGALEAFSALGSKIAEAAAGFREQIQSMAPDQLELAFEVSLTGSKKWIIVSGEVKGTATIKMTWIGGDAKKG
jgi:hypothetical protein